MKTCDLFGQKTKKKEHKSRENVCGINKSQCKAKPGTNPKRSTMSTTDKDNSPRLRVFQIAKRLGISSKEAIIQLQKFGFTVNSAHNTLAESEVRYILEGTKSPLSQEVSPKTAHPKPSEKTHPPIIPYFPQRVSEQLALGASPENKKALLSTIELVSAEPTFRKPLVQKLKEAYKADKQVYWQRMTPFVPEEYYDAKMTLDPHHGLLLLNRGYVAQEFAGVEYDKKGLCIWRWEKNTWAPFKMTLLPGKHYSKFDFEYDPRVGDTVVYIFHEGMLFTFQLNDPTPTEKITHKAITKNRYPNHFSVTYHPEERCMYLLCDKVLLRLVNGQLSKVTGSGSDNITQIRYDPDSKRILGANPDDHWGNLLQLKGKSWEYFAGSTMRSTPCYSQKYQSICALIRGEHFRQYQLAKPDGEGGWSHLPLKTDSRMYGRLHLMEDPETQKLLAYGGMTHAGNNHRAFTFVEEGELLTSSLAEDFPQLFSLTSCQSGEQFYIYDHDTLAVYQYNARQKKWQIALSPLPQEYHTTEPYKDVHFWASNVNFCASTDQTHHMLAQDGAVWTRKQGEAHWKKVAEPTGGPGGAHLKRISLGWDPVGQRLIAFGGYEENRTYAMKDGSWHQIHSKNKPRHGVGSMATTPEGLYMLRFDELWRLVGDEWECVATSEGFPEFEDYEIQEWRWCLTYDPKRSLLFSVSALYDEYLQIAYFDNKAAKWQPILHLPPGINSYILGESDSHFGLDPSTDEFMLLHKHGSYRFPLASLELPEQQLPTQTKDSQSALEDPPDWVLEDAFRLEVLPDKTPYTQEQLSFPIDIPKGSEILAIFPYRPEMECGKQWFKALLFLDRQGNELEHNSPIQPVADYLNEYVILPLQEWSITEPLIAKYNLKTSSYEFIPCQWLPFKELPPHRDGQTRYNTTEDDVYANGTKLRGYARYFRRISGPEFERVSIQLSSDVALSYIYVQLWKGGGEFDAERH